MSSYQIDNERKIQDISNQQKDWQKLELFLTKLYSIGQYYRRFTNVKRCPVDSKPGLSKFRKIW